MDSGSLDHSKAHIPYDNSVAFRNTQTSMIVLIEQECFYFTVTQTRQIEKFEKFVENIWFSKMNTLSVPILNIKVLFSGQGVGCIKTTWTR